MQQYRETLKYTAALREYNKLAKKADRRMRELERFSRWEGYENILKYAYAKAAKMIDQWTPPGAKPDKKPRWQRNTPADTRTLKAKIKDIEAFLAMPSSTKQGIDKIYKKRAESINNAEWAKGYNLKFTWEDLAKFFNSKLGEKAMNQYGSKTTLLAIGTIKANKKKVLDAMVQNSEKLQMVKDESVNQTINDMLSKYGYDIETLVSMK